MVRSIDGSVKCQSGKQQISDRFMAYIHHLDIRSTTLPFKFLEYLPSARCLIHHPPDIFQVPDVRRISAIWYWILILLQSSWEFPRNISRKSIWKLEFQLCTTPWYRQYVHLPYHHQCGSIVGCMCHCKSNKPQRLANFLLKKITYGKENRIHYHENSGEQIDSISN